MQYHHFHDLIKDDSQNNCKKGDIQIRYKHWKKDIHSIDNNGSNIKFLMTQNNQMTGWERKIRKETNLCVIFGVNGSVTLHCFPFGFFTWFWWSWSWTVFLGFWFFVDVMETDSSARIQLRMQKDKVMFTLDNRIMLLKCY